MTVYRHAPAAARRLRASRSPDRREARRKGVQRYPGRRQPRRMRKTGMRNPLYSFGIAHPGAITLHNFPTSLTGFERDGEMIDLSVVDLVRTRRRGVPRYNDFREGLHKPRVTRFEDLTDRSGAVAPAARTSTATVDEIDTMVGLFAENPPGGFGFSDTAFRIFILMASRRLQSDRFLTVDFRPEIYTPLGMDWIASNGMTSVILRHCPDLAAVLPRNASAFAPWRPIVPATGRWAPRGAHHESRSDCLDPAGADAGASGDRLCRPRRAARRGRCSTRCGSGAPTGSAAAPVPAGSMSYQSPASARAADGAGGGAADRDHRLHRPDHARPARSRTRATGSRSWPSPT